MQRVTSVQRAVIDRSKSKFSNKIGFKVGENTLISMIRAGLVEHYTQTEPYFLEYYRLTDKAINLQ